MATNYQIISAQTMVDLKVAVDAFLVLNPTWAPTGEPFYDPKLKYSQSVYLAPAGPPPPINDKNFVYTQVLPATVWTVVHNLNKRCAVQVIDNAFEEFEANITWDSLNQVTIRLKKPKTGYVYCN